MAFSSTAARLASAPRFDQQHRFIWTNRRHQPLALAHETQIFCWCTATGRLTGDKVRWVLAKGCALDLHSDIFVAGMCAQTMLSHAGVTLICEGVDDFILICRTSFASYVLDWLCDAATDVGVEVA